MSDINTVIAQLRTAIATAQAVVGGGTPPLTIPPPADGRTPYPTTFTVPTYAELAFSDVPAAVADGGASFKSSNGKYLDAAIPGIYADSLRWLAIGGDWKDSTGTLYGTSAYDVRSVASGSLQTISWNVLALVNAWLGGAKNYGFFLKEVGSNAVTEWYSRVHATVSNRPVLMLTSTSLGPLTINCARNVELSSASYACLGGYDLLHIGGADQYALFWFDLSAVPHDITAAALVCKTFAQYGNASNVAVFAIWNPGDQSNIDTQHLGVAASYPLDAGIAAHPSVLFAESFADDNYISRFTAWNPSGNSRVSAADGFGFDPTAQPIANAIRFFINAGGAAGGYMNGAWSPWRPQGLHVKALESYDELYFREYVMFGTDWNLQPTGCKLPGWDGRYTAIAGSGTGVTGMGSGNGGTGCGGYDGWSARCGAGVSPDPTDPLAAGSWIGYADVYNIDQTGDGNINNSYGNGASWDKNYLGFFRRGQWYCVEQYIKLNSIIARSPQSITSAVADSSGNFALATLAVPDTIMVNGDFKFISGAVNASFNSQINTGQPPGSSRITVVDSTHFYYALNNHVTAGSTGGGTMTALHNGANADGITRVWINGRLAHEKTDWRFRSSLTCLDGVTPYGIDAVWWNVYFGGVENSVNDSHGYIAMPVIATSYIGPMMALSNA